MSLRVGSLFSGVGGLDYVFAKSREFEIKFFSEIEEAPSSVLKYHHEDVKNYGDISKIIPSELPDIDVLIGGPSCKGFSTQGKMEGLCHDKTGLIKHIYPILKEKKPKYVVIENVKNLLSKQMSSDYEQVIREIRKTGYSTVTKVVDSSNYGTPQQRVRVVILGIRKDIIKSRKNSISNVHKKQIKAESFKGFDSKCSYISWSKSTRDFHIDLRIREDGLIGTLTTGDGCKGVSTGTIVLSKDGVTRNLSVNECEALMTWKKDYTKYGTDNNGNKVEIPELKRYTMCGNGVVSNIMLPIRDFIISYEK